MTERELDRAIAEKVFGCDPLNARHGLHADGDIEYSWGYPLGHDVAPPYSTDIAAAWRVVDEMTRIPRTETEAIRMWNTRFGYWWDSAKLWACTASEAAHEICVAAVRIASEHPA